MPTISLAVPVGLARQVRYADLPPAEDTDFAIRLFNLGCHFVLVEEPGAVWRDVSDPNRSSASRNAECLRQWLEAMKPVMPARAWHGGRGWAYAKLVSHTRLRQALGLYFQAVLRGAYRPRLAVIILLQILLSDTGYRRLADRAISWLRAGYRAPRVAS